MIISAGFLSKVSGGFVEFTTVGTNQTITSGMIPAGVTRVRVHLIGGGGGRGGPNGGASTFSAAGVSVMASGGYGGSSLSYGYSVGGSGGSISRVVGIIAAANGGAGGGSYGDPGVQGGFGIEVGIAMGGGGGAGGSVFFDPCGCGTNIGFGGQVGINPSQYPGFGYGGGAGGGYNSGQTLPAFSDKGGRGGDGNGAGAASGGGGGAYAMFYAPLNGATAYTNAITIGNKGDDGIVNCQSGYCRIEWGGGI